MNDYDDLKELMGISDQTPTAGMSKYEKEAELLRAIGKDMREHWPEWHISSANVNDMGDDGVIRYKIDKKDGTIYTMLAYFHPSDGKFMSGITGQI